MLRRLLESDVRRDRNQAITVASAMVHGMLVIIAAFATAAGAPVVLEEEESTHILWTKPKPPSVISEYRTVKLPKATGTVPGSLPQVALSIDVPSVIPDVSATLGTITRDDFSQPNGIGSGSGDTSGIAGPPGGSRAYTSNEVEVPVSLQRGAQPEYPTALRAAGIQGEVIALFVVDESGRGIAESIRIVSATNDLFAASVRRAIPRMRFTAARIGSHAVPQLVQQLFVFRLDR